MGIIRALQIRNFRSLREVDLRDVSGVNAVTGLNNSGKSNILRALNLFFNDQVDPGEPVDLARDHYSPWAKKRKEISVTVEFDLANTPFSYGKLFKAVEELVGYTPRVRRMWSFDRRGGTTATVSKFALARDSSETYTDLSDDEEIRLMRSFLGLIRYRYLPSHFHPSQIMTEEQDEIKRTLLARLRKSLSLRKDAGPADVETAFETLSRVAGGVIQPIAEAMKEASEEIEEVELVTASGFEDVLFVFGYNVSIAGGTTLPGHLQGLGIQAHLMYQLLHFLDTSFGERFGTRQAVVWGIEEPESFLHMTLEYHVARFFQKAARTGRFQLFCTTHSDIFTRFATAGVLVQLNDGESSCRVMPVRDLVSMAPREGISRFVHDLLYELRPLVIVEGKTDAQYLDTAMEHSARSWIWVVRSLAELVGKESVGGIDQLRKYFVEHRAALESRPIDSPIVVLADWEVRDRQFHKLDNAVSVHPRSKAWRPPETLVNVELGESFVGIERFLGTAAVIAAEEKGWLRLRRPRTAEYPLGVVKKTLKAAKARLADHVCAQGAADDFEHLIRLVNGIDAVVTEAVRHGRGGADDNDSPDVSATQTPADT